MHNLEQVTLELFAITQPHKKTKEMYLLKQLYHLFVRKYLYGKSDMSPIICRRMRGLVVDPVSGVLVARKASRTERGGLT
jgi:hypothetical protein